MCYICICVYEHVCVRACMYLFLLKGGGEKAEAVVERILQSEGGEHLQIWGDTEVPA